MLNVFFVTGDVPNILLKSRNAKRGYSGGSYRHDCDTTVQYQPSVESQLCNDTIYIFVHLTNHVIKTAILSGK